jgi:hypothetical protein
MTACLFESDILNESRYKVEDLKKVVGLRETGWTEDLL